MMAPQSVQVSSGSLAAALNESRRKLESLMPDPFDWVVQLLQHPEQVVRDARLRVLQQLDERRFVPAAERGQKLPLIVQGPQGRCFAMVGPSSLPPSRSGAVPVSQDRDPPSSPAVLLHPGEVGERPLDLAISPCHSRPLQTP